MCACATFDGKHGSIEPYLPPSTHISSLVASLNTTFCLGTPSASKYVRRYGAVEYMLSTRGSPMRMRFSFSCTAGPLLRNGRVVSTFLMLRKPFLRTKSLIGVPAAGIGA